MIEGWSEKQQLGIPVLAHGIPLETSQDDKKPAVVALAATPFTKGERDERIYRWVS
jgi:hypothetical protein